jgi:UDP-GlcNAc:undecaprenyl-phosphate GlcNAc-1-phosphate transferase
MMPLTVLLLPLVDMTFAIVRRTRQGRSPFSADRGHLHHRLLEIGHTPRRAVLIMYFWSALIAFLTVLFSVTPQRRPLIIGAMAFFGLGMVLLMLPWVQRSLDSRAAHRSAVRRPLTRWPGVTRVGGLAPRHRRVEPASRAPVVTANGTSTSNGATASRRKTPHDSLTGR